MPTMRPLRPAERQWLFDPSALDKTPSRLDDIPLQSELESRKLAIEWIRSLWLRVAAGHSDGDPEATTAKGIVTVGAVLVHRFFMRRSIKDFEPKLIAPTILFLSSKIEEGPLRLRHIVNACLAKFEPGAPLWDPSEEPDVQPLEYRRWEKEILAAEEVALEALCFDMAVEQPWPVLRRSVRGLDAMWLGEAEAESSAAAEARATANGNGHEYGGKGKGRATEAVVNELGWALLNEGLLAPLPVLHSAPVLALMAFVLVLAMCDEMPISVATAAAAELGAKFGVDVEFDPELGAKGEDVKSVQDAVQQYIDYCDAGIVDKGLTQYIVSEPSADEPRTFRRRFKQTTRRPVANGVGKSPGPGKSPAPHKSPAPTNGDTHRPQ